jgi:N-acetylmuramic acid 6-phosphate etherase
MAGGEPALVRAVEGAEDDTDAARAALAAIGLAHDDVVLSIAASGRTPYAIAALNYARETGALAVGIFNNRGAALGEVADIAILIDTGPELIAGSTRMKAGTTQKVVLNCISTGVMVRLGYVYRGLMVEMKPTNNKLRQRAELMVAELAGVDIDSARRALADGGTIKTATVMLLKGMQRAEAEALLAKSNGNLRTALGS